MTGDKLTDALITLVILSIVIERALAVFFESKMLEEKFSKNNLKPVLAGAVSFIVCWIMNFNVLESIAESCATTTCDKAAFSTNPKAFFGIVVTASIVAGGSAGSVKLFQDILGFRRSSREEAKQLAKAEQEANQAEAAARKAKAEAETELAKAQASTAQAVAQNSVPGAAAAAIQDAMIEHELDESYSRYLRAKLAS